MHNKVKSMTISSEIQYAKKSYENTPNFQDCLKYEVTLKIVDGILEEKNLKVH